MKSLNLCAPPPQGRKALAKGSTLNTASQWRVKANTDPTEIIKSFNYLLTIRI